LSVVDHSSIELSPRISEADVADYCTRGNTSN
jgi:hypothetical protein